MKKLTVSGLLLLLCISCGSALEAGPWKGKIMDVETKEPLEGTVVLAVWERVYRTPYGANSYFYEAKEVVTNKAGEFEILSYTPINFLPIISYMRGPSFTIFKPSYGNVDNMSIGGYFTGEVQKEQNFELSGRRYRYALGVIELPRLKTREERIKSLNAIEGFPVGYAPNQKLTNLLIQIDLENKSLGLK
jgi:hypothetical protein